jgi:hypothetical protein
MPMPRKFQWGGSIGGYSGIAGLGGGYDPYSDGMQSDGMGGGFDSSGGAGYDPYSGYMGGGWGGGFDPYGGYDMTGLPQFDVQPAGGQEPPAGGQEPPATPPPDGTGYNPYSGYMGGGWGGGWGGGFNPWSGYPQPPTPPPPGGETQPPPPGGETQPPTPPPPGGETQPPTPPPPTTGGETALPPPTDAGEQAPYVAGAQTSTVSRDPALEQLLFGLDGQGGFIPGAMQAAETTFFNPDGTPRVVDQEVAGFTPDQQRAMELARGQIGIQDRYLSDAESAYREGVSRSDLGLDRQRNRERLALGAMQRGVAEEEALRDRGLEGLLSSIGEGRELARGATSDLYGRLGETEDIQRGAVDQFGRRLSDVEAMGTGAADRFGGRMDIAEQRGLEAADRFGGELGGIEAIRRGAADEFGQRLGESESLMRGTTGAYDQDLTRQFYDPYEDRVVAQTIEDALEGADKADMAQFAQDVGRGGESAFGSRARLTAGERREDLGRGLAKELAGIRSRGFTEAQRMGTSEFARQKAAEMGAGRGLAGLSGQRLGAQQQLASGLGSLSGQRLAAETGAADRLTGGARQRLGAETGVIDLFGRTGGQQLAAQQGLASGLGQAGRQRYQAGTGLGSTLVGLGQTGQQALSGAGQAALGSAGQLAGAQSRLGGIQGQIGQQQLQARQGFGGFMQGLGGQAQQAGLAGINALAGFGGQQQQLQQRQLDAQRQNLLAAQQAPLAQYQSLLPFIQAVPAGQQTSQQTFAPSPSPLQAGLGTGLSAFGGIGSFMNQGRNPQPYYQQPYYQQPPQTASLPPGYFPYPGRGQIA